MLINIRSQTIDSMMEIIKLDCLDSIKIALYELLNHCDYKLELDRYNKHGLERGFSREEAYQFLLCCLGVETSEIKKEKLALRKCDMISFIEQVREDKFCFNFDEKELFSMVKVAVERANFGLEAFYKVDNVEVIFSVGLGSTGGWFHGSVVHIDIVQFMNPLNRDEVIGVLAHEIHHIGMMRFYKELWESDLSLKERFLTAFAGEGLAVKYGNNGSGILTRPLYDSKINAGLDQNDFEFFENNFLQMYDKFKTTLKKIEINEIYNLEMLNQAMSSYWTLMDKENRPKYHSRMYYWGCNIWGLIHDTYGTEKVFEILRNAENFESYFNQALIERGKTKFIIE